MADYTLNKTGEEIDASLAKADSALQPTDVVDDLTTSNPSKPLSAKQGKALNDKMPQASSSTPVMNGTAAIGSSSRYARADHVHPHDTTKQDKLTAGSGISINGNTISATGGGGGGSGTITGITMNGVSQGTSGIVDLGDVVTSITDTPTQNSSNVQIPFSKGSESSNIKILAATKSRAGVMTSQMREKLDALSALLTQVMINLQCTGDVSHDAPSFILKSEGHLTFYVSGALEQSLGVTILDDNIDITRDCSVSIEPVSNNMEIDIDKGTKFGNVLYITVFDN